MDPQKIPAGNSAPPKASSSFIGESETRSMVRLLGEIAIHEGSLADKRSLLMKGLCSLVGADAWMFVHMGKREPGERPTFAAYHKSGFTEKQFATYLLSHEHNEMKESNASFLAEFATKKTHLTRLRQQIHPNEEFLRSEVLSMWKEADIAPTILSIFPTESGHASGVVLFRRYHRELFSPRDSRITHILLSEIPWIHESPGDRVKEVAVIPPRLNTVLNLLIQGLGRKQIASELGLSIHTVHGYAKDLYRRFGVHSQSELILRFIEGDGGDTP